MATAVNPLCPLESILLHEADFWQVISHVEEQRGWTAFHNPRLPLRYDPNHAGIFRGSDEDAERIVREVITFYHSRGATPAAYVDKLSTPIELEKELQRVGFVALEGSESDLMIYVGPDESSKPNNEIKIEVVQTHDSCEDWASIIDEESDHKNQQELREICTLQIRDSQVTGYLGRVDGIPAAHCLLFSSKGLGRVESVRTLSQFCHRGLATALVRKAVLDSLSKGNSLTYIHSEPQSSAQRIYHRIGFRTVAHNALKTFTLTSD